MNFICMYNSWYNEMGDKNEVNKLHRLFITCFDIFSSKEEEEKSTITEITEAYQISRNHLTKVIHQLGQIGLIETTRGRGGGIVLAKRPSDIIIGDVVRETEEDFRMVEC